jgi:hypothetical protein
VDRCTFVGLIKFGGGCVVGHYWGSFRWHG